MSNFATPTVTGGMLAERDLRTAVLTALILVQCAVGVAQAQIISLAWDPNTEPNVTGYHVAYGTSSGVYTTTIDVGNVTSYQFTPPDPTVGYYLGVRAYGTGGALSPYSNEVVTTPSLAVTGLSANKTSPQSVGASITFAATATGGTSPYQFKWWIDSGTTSTVGQQWSTSNTFTWTPSTPSPGTTIRVWARNASSTADAPDNSRATLEMTFVITAADKTPPLLSNGLPVGILPVGTLVATLGVTTSEASTCRYGSMPGVAYASMPTTFSVTGGTLHTSVLSGLVNGGSYTRYVRCQDGAGNANLTDFTIAFSVATLVDTTPPVITGVQATGVTTGGATIQWTTDEAADSQVQYGLTTGYGSQTTLDASKVLAHGVTLSGLSADTVYHYRVLSRDAADNLAQSADFTVRTAAAASGATLTLWPPTATPETPSSGDTSPVEVGVKFRADVSGEVLGVRFYKGPGNSGVHVGSLWSASGVRLASATFTSETATGWQEVRFAAPVAIAANTTYVVSYHMDTGRYARNYAYFATAWDNGPLHAPDAGSAGGNGVYAYGPSAFPSSSYQASNYWVDVVFQSGGSAPPPPPSGTAPVTLWPDAVTPSYASFPSTAALEVGVKFQSDVAGSVVGVRFYKGPGNTGPHIGNLWTAAGTLLATAVFSGETASGWQEVRFAAPVPIAPNTMYVVSYHMDQGGYALTYGYFSGNAVHAAPLHALSSTAVGGNGVYIYGPSAFPSSSYLGSNYWVDVLFLPQ